MHACLRNRLRVHLVENENLSVEIFQYFLSTILSLLLKIGKSAMVSLVFPVIVLRFAPQEPTHSVVGIQRNGPLSSRKVFIVTANGASVCSPSRLSDSFSEKLNCFIGFF
mmetsp:Transcript_8647/g.13575  ORF Transcript_8647/g.13575 Transcript_8647/m.13575 type:complete len:110 (+) Transcript_8647:49-378(+)